VMSWNTLMISVSHEKCSIAVIIFEFSINMCWYVHAKGLVDLMNVKASSLYSCSCDSLCSRVMWTMWQVTRQAIPAARATGSWSSACCLYIKGVRLASNWSSVDDDLRAQVKARRVSRRARARVMWTGLKRHRPILSLAHKNLCR
jgi:hypothetical protein